MACRRKMQCALVHFAQHLEDHEVRWNVFVLIRFLNTTFGRPRIALECFCFCRPPPPKHGTFPEPPRFGSAARDPTGVLHFANMSAGTASPIKKQKQMFIVGTKKHRMKVQQENEALSKVVGTLMCCGSIRKKILKKQVKV